MVNNGGVSQLEVTLLPVAAKSFGLVALALLVGAASVLYHSLLFPLGATASGGLIIMLSVALRLLFNSRGYLGVAVVAMILVLVVASGVGSDGSFLIVANSSGYLFLGLATLGMTITIAWPRFPSRANR